MKIINLLIIFANLLHIYAGDAHADNLKQLEVTDFTGTRVTLPAPPKRIVTLAPSLGELVADLLGNDLSSIVGVSEFTDYPLALTKTASIGPYNHFSVEKVASLKPEVVFATIDGNAKEQVLALRNLGIPVVVTETANFMQLEQAVRLIAQAIGAAPLGEEMITRFHTGLARLKSRTTGKIGKTGRTGHKPRVLLQLGENPAVVAGKLSLQQEMLDTIGAVNVYDDSTTRYPRPALEDIINRNPELIIILGMNNKELAKQMATHWLQFPSLAAVKNRKIRILPGDTLLRPTMRILEGLALLEKTVYE